MSESDDSPHLSRGSSGHSGQSNSEVWSSSISQFEERQANLLASNRATACNTFLVQSFLLVVFLSDKKKKKKKD